MRHMVSGQLHNERSRITGEQLRLFRMMPEMMMAAKPMK